MWRDQVGQAAKDAIVKEGENIGMLQGSNLAGLILKVFQVDFMIPGRRIHRRVQEAQEIGTGGISAREKGRSDLALPDEPFETIIPQGCASQLIKRYILNHSPST